MSQREIEIRPGMFGKSSALNHFASEISDSSSLMSPDAQSTWNPSMSEFGNGHGWLPKYRRFVTSTPTLNDDQDHMVAAVKWLSSGSSAI